MEYSQLIQERCSVRAFSDRPVDEAGLAALLQAARAAPSAVNKQPFRLLVEAITIRTWMASGTAPRGRRRG